MFRLNSQVGLRLTTSSSSHESEMCWLAGGEVDVPDAAVEVEVEPGCRRLDQCVSTGVTADLMKEILELSHLRAVKSDLEVALSSEGSRVDLARRLGQLENSAVLSDCKKCIAEGAKSPWSHFCQHQQVD